MVSISGMTVSLRTDLRFPITGQQGHESRNIQITRCMISTKRDDAPEYKNSKITIEMKINDDIGKNINLELKLELQSQDNAYDMMSVTEKIYAR